MIDITGESSKHEIQSALKLSFTSNVDDIKSSNVYIISVPTPVNSKNNPNLSILFNASAMVGKVLKKNDIVIYESADILAVLKKTAYLF